MAEIRLKVPVLQWGKEEVEAPTSKTGIAATLAAQALKTQQGRISQWLPRRTQEATLKPGEAVTVTAQPGGGSRRWWLLGLGLLAGTGIGVLIAPTTGRNARSTVGQKTGKYARTTAEQAARSATVVASTVGGKTQTVRARVGRQREYDTSWQTVHDRVQTELGRDPELHSLPRINVQVEPGGIVYLRGPVPDESVRQRAEQVARKARGVQDVINELSIVPPGADVSDKGPADEALIQRVRAQLGQDEVLGSVLLEVDSEVGGTVFLRGTVRSESDRERAEQIARTVEGVNVVVNDLAVVSPGPDIVEEDRGQGTVH